MPKAAASSRSANALPRAAGSFVGRMFDCHRAQPDFKNFSDSAQIGAPFKSDPATVRNAIARSQALASRLIILGTEALVGEAGVGVEVAGRSGVLLEAHVVPAALVDPGRVVAVVVGGAAIRIVEELHELARRMIHH